MTNHESKKNDINNGFILNKLAKARYKLSAKEHCIIRNLVYTIQPEDEKFKVYKFELKGLTEQMGIENLDELRLVTEALLKKRINVKSLHFEIQACWISSAEYKEEYLEIEISPRMKPYFIRLKEDFEKYKPVNIVKIHDIYATRIYEALKTHEKKGEYTVTLDELKDILCLEFHRYNDIKRIIIRAQDKISKTRDIKFNFKENKTSHKVTSLTFYISNKVI